MSAPFDPRFRLVAERGRAHVYQPLRPDQEAVLRAIGTRPVLVVGGPGTGKTTLAAEAAARAVRSGESPDRVWVATYSRAGAAALRAQIASLLPDASAPIVSTLPGLCRRVLAGWGAAADPGSAPLRLLSAPDQDATVREVLAHGNPRLWPDALRPALGTAEFAEELRALFARTRALGLDPDDLVEIGRRERMPEWESAGRFFEEYLEILDAQQVLDYAEMVHRARLLLADPERGSQVRAGVGLLIVDEYQDTDAAQVGFLRQLVGPGGPLLAVADPDQAIYRFRGTSPRSIPEFVERFSSPGRPAPVLPLGASTRLGAAVGAAVSAVRDRLTAAPGVDAEVTQAWKHPRWLGERGRAQVAVCPDDAAQADTIAAHLRTAHLDDGVPWSAMAVIVRSARRAIPRLARALASHGVPVEVAGDEVALADEPAVRPLLLALEVASERRTLDGDAAASLLGSPLAGLDAVGRRRLARGLRHSVEAPAASADDVLAAALRAPTAWDTYGPDGARAARLASLLAECRARLAESGSTVEALWALWDGTDWPQRLRAEALGGSEGARQAHRSLDAVCALFELAARHTPERGGPVEFIASLQAQRIPGDVGRESGRGRDAVRLLTAHRAKGLDWDVVVVAGVQDGLWPNLRTRDGLLHADRLLGDGLSGSEPIALRVADERRLFYVACSRARRDLLVTAVDDGAGERPSRFIGELGLPLRPAPRLPRRPRTLAGLVAELRLVAADPERPPELRAGAEVRLARLADLTDARGRPLAPWADPERWWGVLEPSGRAASVARPDAPVELTPSGLETLLECPRRWFLQRQARVEQARTTASLGSVVHAIVEHAAADGWDRAECERRLDGIWPELTFAAPWQEQAEREQAEQMLRRYERWDAERDADLVGVEVPFDVSVRVGNDQVRIKGAVDRLERVGDRLRIVDFKTGSTAPTKAEAAQLPQFGLYQLAVRHGGFAATTPERVTAGAVGVYLRNESRGRVKEVAQDSLDDHPWPAGAEPGPEPTWIEARLREAVATVRQGEFPAQTCASCRFCPYRAACPAQREGEQVNV